MCFIDIAEEIKIIVVLEDHRQENKTNIRLDWDINTGNTLWPVGLVHQHDCISVHEDDNKDETYLQLHSQSAHM
jgi:hypothetical protein